MGMIRVHKLPFEMAATATEQSVLSKVIRLDYDYPPAPGDIDFPGSYDYDVPSCFIGTGLKLRRSKYCRWLSTTKKKINL